MAATSATSSRISAVGTTQPAFEQDSEIRQSVCWKLDPPCSTILPSQGCPIHRPVKTSRIELRATEDDRVLLDRAATALGTDRISFLLAQGRLAIRPAVCRA